MASAGTVDCLAKRDLLASGKASPEKLKAQAEAFIEAGMDYDGLRFLASAGETEEVAAVAARAVREGDLFLYLQARKELGREPDPEELLRLSKAAAAKGILSFAQRAESMASPDEGRTDV